MTTKKSPLRTSAAPLAGKLVWWAALAASLFLVCGVWFAHLEGGLSRPFLFPYPEGVGDRSTFYFAAGIGILLGLPVLRDLIVLIVSMRQRQNVPAILATVGAGGLLFVYAWLWRNI